MRWLEALKVWNAEHNPGKWCVAKKGSAEYDQVKAIMERGKAAAATPAAAPKTGRDTKEMLAHLKAKKAATSAPKAPEKPLMPARDYAAERRMIQEIVEKHVKREVDANKKKALVGAFLKKVVDLKRKEKAAKAAAPKAAPKAAPANAIEKPAADDLARYHLLGGDAKFKSQIKDFEKKYAEYFLKHPEMLYENKKEELAKKRAEAKEFKPTSSNKKIASIQSAAIEAYAASDLGREKVDKFDFNRNMAYFTKMSPNKIVAIFATLPSDFTKEELMGYITNEKNMKRMLSETTGL